VPEGNFARLWRGFPFIPKNSVKLQRKQYYFTQHIIYRNKMTGKTTGHRLLSQHNQKAKELLIASL
jgi:hypothetical protein